MAERYNRPRVSYRSHYSYIPNMRLFLLCCPALPLVLEHDWDIQDRCYLKVGKRCADADSRLCVQPRHILDILYRKGYGLSLKRRFSLYLVFKTFKINSFSTCKKNYFFRGDDFSVDQKIFIIGVEYQDLIRISQRNSVESSGDPVSDTAFAKRVSQPSYHSR